MNAETIREIIAERAQTNDEREFGVERCWKKLTDALLEDLPWTIGFLDNECTADELSWISEVFEELILKSQSQELIACLRRAIAKYPEEDLRFNLTLNLDSDIEGFWLDDATREDLLSASPGDARFR